MPQIRPYVAFGLAALLFLAVIGKSAVMMASVVGMAAAWAATKDRELSARLGIAALVAVAVALAAEGGHTLYHQVVSGAEAGGFWRGAFLVGLINGATFLAWVLLGERVSRWRQGRASRSSAP